MVQRVELFTWDVRDTRSTALERAREYARFEVRNTLPWYLRLTRGPASRYQDNPGRAAYLRVAG